MSRFLLCTNGAYVNLSFVQTITNHQNHEKNRPPVAVLRDSEDRDIGHVYFSTLDEMDLCGVVVPAPAGATVMRFWYDHEKETWEKNRVPVLAWRIDGTYVHPVTPLAACDNEETMVETDSGRLLHLGLDLEYESMAVALEKLEGARIKRGNRPGPEWQALAKVAVEAKDILGVDRVRKILGVRLRDVPADQCASMSQTLREAIDNPAPPPP